MTISMRWLVLSSDSQEELYKSLCHHQGLKRSSAGTSVIRSLKRSSTGAPAIISLKRNSAGTYVIINL